MSAQPDGPVWTLEAPRLESGGGVSRVCCRVEGEDIWFESEDLALLPRMEAFAGALLTSALRQGVRLALQSPVEADWLAQQRRLAEIHRRWWYDCSAFPLEGAPAVSSPALRGRRKRGAKLTGSCFTCGVDSFETLLRRQKEVDVLFFVQGYDIPLEDAPRMAAQQASMAAVARQLGKRVVVLRTNLRSHPCYALGDWRHSHGAALAAAGLVATALLGKLLIPSSYYYHINIPWGSHWETDFLHTTHDFQVEHDGQHLYRHKKLMRIAHHPLFQEHVRVCWAHFSESGNCGNCEKCIRTMTSLYAIGTLAKTPAFPQEPDLLTRIRQLPPIPREALITTWSILYAFAPQPELRRAILELVGRSFPGSPLRLPPGWKEPGMHIMYHWNAWRSLWRQSRR